MHVWCCYNLSTSTPPTYPLLLQDESAPLFRPLILKVWWCVGVVDICLSIGPCLWCHVPSPESWWHSVAVRFIWWWSDLSQPDQQWHIRTNANSQCWVGHGRSVQCVYGLLGCIIHARRRRKYLGHRNTAVEKNVCSTASWRSYWPRILIAEWETVGKLWNGWEYHILWCSTASVSDMVVHALGFQLAKYSHSSNFTCSMKLICRISLFCITVQCCIYVAHEVLWTYGVLNLPLWVVWVTGDPKLVSVSVHEMAWYVDGYTGGWVDWWMDGSGGWYQLFTFNMTLSI